MQYLLPLLVTQVIILLWLHYMALQKNLYALQRYVASQTKWKQNGVWVEGTKYSFHLCQKCTNAVLGP
jgi:hypothetical protein